MSFVHPWALLGLFAAAIPALLHLLQRRTPPELDFPPLRYLSDAERRSARRLKLRHVLLLLLRTALIVVIVVAAARPLVPTPSAGGSGGGGTHAPTALVVVLDNSLSSGVMVDGRPLLERLRAAAAGSLRDATAADRLWLMLADGVARTGIREALVAAVESVATDWRRLDLVAAVRRAGRLAEAEPLAAREVHVVSDLQRTALSTGRADVPPGVRVLVHTVPAAPGVRPPANRGLAWARVTDVGGAGGGGGAGRVARGAVSVAVVGTPTAGPGSVTVRLRSEGGGGGSLREGGRGLAAPGEELALPLPSLPPGWWEGEAELEPDELRVDDRRLFVWRVAPPARVTAGIETGPFVATAMGVLRDGGRILAGGDVTIAERPSPGAGLTVVLPPDDPALAGQANRALAARGVAWRFAGPGTPGPATVSPATLEMIAGIQVNRRLRLEAPTAPRLPDSSVLARVNGEPWLVRDGSGVVVLGSRLDTAWSVLPAHPGFVPFVDALVNRVVRGEAAITQLEGAARVAFEIRSGDTLGATVYGPDPRESDLTPASADDLRRALGDAAAVLGADEFAARRFAGMRRADLTGLLLALALALAAVELGVATLTR